MIDLREKLARRMHFDDLFEVGYLTQGRRNDALKEELYRLIDDADDRVGYNALWAFSHFTLDDNEWLYAKRDNLIDKLLVETHVGKRRLILTLLERQPARKEDVRADYLDFCLSRICSAEPYAIRALCLKQAYAQCRHYPELMGEFMETIALLDQAELSPGLKSARRIILARIAKGR